MRSSFQARSAFPFLFLALLTTGASGAPLWGSPSIVGQPDGSKAEVRLFGDEFYYWMENPGGYTVVRDPHTGWLCYAEVSADGKRLISTGVQLSDMPPAGLEIGIRLDDSVVADIVAMERSRNDLAGEKILDKPPVINGQVVGITILVDFPDLDFETDVSDPVDQQAWMDDVHDFLNMADYTGHGNNGSVFDYFNEVSGNNLSYNNQVSSRFYESTATRAALAAGSASWDDVLPNILHQMDAEGFDFGQYDSNDDGLIDAINIYYWGPLGFEELWPHYADMDPVVLDGSIAGHYTVGALRDYPELLTFCHETGHLLGQWPDLYSVAIPRDGFGLGDYCLMAWGGSGALDPVNPSAFPKKLAGWMEPIVLDRAGTGLVATSGNNSGYIIPHPDPTITNEYFLVENRQEIGRDDRIDDSGLAIYHVDENQLYQTYSNHYMVHLVQADGLWQLENAQSFGNATDLYAGPDYPDYDPHSDPRATWWNGDLIESYIQNVSTSGPVMTFDYPGCSQLVRVTVTPPDMGFEWTLTGPNGYSYSGTANNEFIVPNCGEYTVSFETMPLYSTPATVIQYVGATGDPVIDFAGTYALFFNHGGPNDLGDTGNAAALCAMDYDNDGDDDLFIANQGSSNRLLINGGNSGFINMPPQNLALAGTIVDASWADGDNDGDQDVILVRGQGGHLILENQGAMLVDISAYSADLRSTTDVTAGNWGDIDNNGTLDFFLARYNNLNQVYEGVAGSSIQLLPGAISVPASTGNATSGVHWGDINDDGWNDLLLNGRSHAPSDLTRVLENLIGNFRFWSGNVNVIREGRDAVWADFNNDGNLDIAVLASDGTDACYLLDPSGFVYFSTTFPPHFGATSLVSGDFNNDGWVDLYATRSGTSDILAINQLRTPGGVSPFTRFLTFGDDEMVGANQVAVTGDFNADGKLDLYVARDGAPNFLIENQVGGGNHWLEVDLTGVSCNRDALGARITVVAGGLTQIREVQSDGGPGQNSKVAHFGLGSATEVDLVSVRWPGFGPVQVYPDPVAVDSRISITQPNELPVISAFIDRGGQQLPIADNNLHGCPAGDGDMLVIHLDFDDEYMAGVPQILPNRISLITDGLGYEFYDDSSLDTPGTPANSYTVTIRRSQVGGCGLCMDFGCNDPASDPLPLNIRFDESLVGSIADLRVQSADITSGGWVNLQDLPALAQAVFGNPVGLYFYYCADFVHDGVVNLLDIAYFSGHYGHENPSASARSGPGFVSDARIRFLPEASEPAGGDQMPAHRQGIQRVFPNPFNPSVTIEYALDHPAQVTLQVHDLAGRLVATLVDQYQTPQGGPLSAVWDGKNRSGRRAASGAYFWRLTIGEQVESGRMMLLK